MTNDQYLLFGIAIVFLIAGVGFLLSDIEPEQKLVFVAAFMMGFAISAYKLVKND